MTNTVQKIKDSVDMKTVVSVVAGLALFGGITYAAVKSGIKPLATAAKAVK